MDSRSEQVGMPLQSQHGEAGTARVERPSPAAVGAAGESDATSDGGVDKIREILFGGHMRDYDKRFAGLEERVTRDVAALRDETNRRFDALQAFMRQELDALGQRLSDEHKSRTESVQALGDDLRHRLSDQGQQLNTELARRFDELSASLDQQSRSLRHDKADRSTVAALLTEVAQRLAGQGNLGGAGREEPEHGG